MLSVLPPWRGEIKPAQTRREMPAGREATEGATRLMAGHRAPGDEPGLDWTASNTLSAIALVVLTARSRLGEEPGELVACARDRRHRQHVDLENWRRRSLGAEVAPTMSSAP
jgi:hypothetical protein